MKTESNTVFVPLKLRFKRSSKYGQVSVTVQWLFTYLLQDRKAAPQL